MNYIAVKTRGTKTDYSWNLSAENTQNEHVILESLTDEKHSISVIRTDLGFSVYIGGTESERIDEKNRKIRISVAFCGLEECQVRRLVIFAIRNPDVIREALRASVHTPANNLNCEWKVDFKPIERIVLDATTTVALKQKQTEFSDAWERFYTSEYSVENDEERANLKKELLESHDNLVLLASELEGSSFTTGHGIKLLVSRTPSTHAYERAISEADRLMTAEPSERNLLILRNKKKAGSTPTQSPRSKTQSKTQSQVDCRRGSIGCFLHQLGTNSRACSWIGSNKGLLIICAGLLVGITVGIKSCKKKDEPEDKKIIQQVAPQLSASLNQGLNKENEFHENKAADENKDRVNQNTDLESPTDNEKRYE